MYEIVNSLFRETACLVFLHLLKKQHYIILYRLLLIGVHAPFNFPTEWLFERHEVTDNCWRWWHFWGLIDDGPVPQPTKTWPFGIKKKKTCCQSGNHLHGWKTMKTQLFVAVFFPMKINGWCPMWRPFLVSRNGPLQWVVSTQSRTFLRWSHPWSVDVSGINPSKNKPNKYMEMLQLVLSQYQCLVFLHFRGLWLFGCSFGLLEMVSSKPKQWIVLLWLSYFNIVLLPMINLEVSLGHFGAMDMLNVVH